MDLNNTKYIVLELIPTSLNPEKGLIIQLSALKLDGLKLLDRFDYRLKEELNPYPQMVEMFSYYKDSFTYILPETTIASAGIWFPDSKIT